MSGEAMPKGFGADVLGRMVSLAGGSFLMGSDSHEGFTSDGEGPVREIELKPFRIDRFAVSNGQFSSFVAATGYVTEAERFGWSFVFEFFVAEGIRERAERVRGTPWWLVVEGACWCHPEGPGSEVDDRQNHPVTHVSWNDAMAYCDWAGTRLPSEAEWEYAARGGLVQKRYAWGDGLFESGQHLCNIWQGTFPTMNTAADGYIGTAPVDAYRPNGFGLHNVCGNVWEWCSDWFSPDFHVHGTHVDPHGPPRGTEKVIRGGSYLCHDSYCNRYRVAARSRSTPNSSTGHSGFRCAADA